MKWKDIPAPQIPGTVKLTSTTKKRRAKILKANINRALPSSVLNSDEVLSRFREKITNAEFSQTRRDGQLTFKNRRDVVDGYGKLLHGMNPTHFLTFMPGRFVKPETIVANITKFCCRLERKALGRNWSKYTRDRIRLVGFLEHPDITPHYHAVVSIPPITEAALVKYGDQIWTTLMPAGKLDAQLIISRKKVVGYVKKDLHHYWSPENVAIYAPNGPNW